MTRRHGRKMAQVFKSKVKTGAVKGEQTASKRAKAPDVASQKNLQGKRQSSTGSDEKLTLDRIEEATSFSNVDLDILCGRGMPNLLRAFSAKAFPLKFEPVKGGIFANFELLKQPKTPEVAIRGFVDLIRKLSVEDRMIWNKAKRRDFSIGVVAGSKSSSYEIPLPISVLTLAAEVGARIVFVVYVRNL